MKPDQARKLLMPAGLVSYVSSGEYPQVFAASFHTQLGSR